MMIKLWQINPTSFYLCMLNGRDFIGAHWNWAMVFFWFVHSFVRSLSYSRMLNGCCLCPQHLFLRNTLVWFACRWFDVILMFMTTAHTVSIMWIEWMNSDIVVLFMVICTTESHFTRQMTPNRFKLATNCTSFKPLTHSLIHSFKMCRTN